MGTEKHGEDTKLHRGIGSRQLSMIAIGGAIGTGLWFASGSAISSAGPGGAMVAFGLMGLIVFFMMTSLGEMATQLPLVGSFEAYANRFIDPAFGFAVGWNYWFSWSITVAAEFVAAGLIVKFWLPDIPVTVVAIISFTLLMALNLISARSFAEAEYWFAGIKVVTIAIFLIVGVLMIVGIMNGHSMGFQNWTLDAGDGRKAPFVGGFAAMMMVFLVAGFSFQGTEIVGLAAAEAKNPEKNVPKAIKSVFWRILLFYIGSIFVVGTLVSFTDPQLLGGGIDNIAASPMVIVFKNAGFAAAASVLNAVILTSVLSCGNSGLYTSSRMLHAMALRGNAPKFFSKVNKKGVPVYAVWATGLIGALAFFASLIGEGKAYYIFYNASGLSGFMIWLGIAICHYRFRKAWVKQGHSLDELKYKALFYPFAPIFAMVSITIVIFGANVWVFEEGAFTWFDFITNYCLIVIIPGLYFWYKWKHKTKVVPLDECDFTIPAGETVDNK
ncbi:MAG: amino acid permease [Bacillota bacterium]|jgi:amino acid permease|nr:amino acid permease [Bacillota bacterium]